MASVWTVLAVAFLNQYAQAWQPQQIPLVPFASPFDWTSLEPLQTLRYVPCYEDLQCARLDVPLNWNSTNQSARVAIAIARLPAKVPVTDPRYGGAILINPGGPGESGVDEVVQRGRDIQKIVDSDPDSTAGKFFDIIGFDPRGVKHTTPSLRCFPNAFNQQLWLLDYQDFSLLWESDASIGIELARTKALSHSCAEVDEADIIRFLNTAQVVEDMLEIVERHGQWRQAEGERILASHSMVEDFRASLRESIAWTRGYEKLLYWGVSYGTLLGQTFAAVHPNRVGRLVIDGVLDPDDYYTGGWLANLQDSDQIMGILSQYCFAAGSSKCPMYKGTTASDIEYHIEQLIDSFKLTPMAVLDDEAQVRGPEVVTYRDVYLRAIGAMHSPFTSAESFFTLLSELARGNTSRIAYEKSAQKDVTASLARCKDRHSSPNGCFPEQYFGLLSSTPVIECMDSAARGSSNRNLTVSIFKAYYTILKSQSKWLASSWARHKLSCVGMLDVPAWHPSISIAASNTSHPLLIIGNTADTVTPIRNGRRVATLFPGSEVLQQNSAGHCSHAHPSLCTARRVRNYFQSGTLPEAGTVCEPDVIPFVDDLDDLDVSREGELELWQALVRVSRGRKQSWVEG